MKNFTVMAAVLVATMPAAANAQILDFNSPPAEYGDPIVDSGFQFDFSANGWGKFMGSDGACCDINDNGTRALFASGGSPASFTMTKVGGGTFSVSALDASVYYRTAPANTIQLIGTLFGGGTITHTINTSTAWATFALPSSFTNLTSLQFLSGTNGGFLSDSGLAIDNINLGAHGVVPEPETWALMILGFGLVGAAARRSRRARLRAA